MSFYSYDKTVVVGKVGRDADTRYTPTGTQVTNFSVAVDRSYKDKNGEQMKKTIWYRVNIWGKLAEVCASVKKGDTILVEGNLEPDENGNPRMWKSEGGDAKAAFELKANEIKFLSPKSEKTAKNAPDIEEEIPF